MLNWFKRLAGRLTQPKSARSDKSFLPDAQAEDAAFIERLLAAEPAKPESEDKPREGYYLFAHRVLPQLLFDDADTFFNNLEQEGAAVLKYTWAKLFIRARQMPSQVELDALDVKLEPVFGRKTAWLTLPPPAAVAEVHYAALIAEEPSGDECRYLILEKTFSESGDPEAVLCEWLSDGSRRNHRIHVAPSFPVFQQIVREQLMRERQRERVGEEPVQVPSWNPGAGDDPTQGIFQPEPLQVQLCMLGYVVLPECVFTNLKALESAVDRRQAPAFLSALWQEVMERCREAELPTEELALAMSAERFERAGLKGILITLPEPLGPPQPYYAAVIEAGDSVRYFTLESASSEPQEGPLLAEIDESGTHGILGEIPSCDRAAFLEGIRTVLAEDELTPTPHLLSQLLQYRLLHHLFRGPHTADGEADRSDEEE